MCRSIGFLLSILTAGALLAAPAVSAETQTGLTVTETASVDAKPDIARVAFGVVTEDRDPAAASRENARITNAVIDAIRRFGIPREDLETASYRVEPIVNYQARPPVTTGYRVSNVVNVTQRNLERVGQLIDVGIKAGANVVQGVNFTIEDPTPFRREALVKAIGQAKSKAQLMAENLGVRLGTVISASESVFYPVPLDRPMYARADAAPTPIMPGDIEVNATVTITYAIL